MLFRTPRTAYASEMGENSLTTSRNFNLNKAKNMKKKMMTLLLAMAATLGAHAQFEARKVYAGASLTGLNLSYSGSSDLNLGMQAKLGYFPVDNAMLLADIDVQASASKLVPNRFMIGGGGRYYIIQNGLYLGANAKFVHTKNYNDFMPGVELGYAFFISETVTIEPALYYDQSLKNHSDYSTVGLKVGIGVYL